MKVKCTRAGIIFMTVAVAIFMNGPWCLAQQAKEVKVGALLTLTGALAQAGKNHKNVVEFAANDINAKGGIKSLGGAKLTLAFGDSQAKPEIAVSETEKLIQSDKVSIIIDQYPSVTTMAATSVAERLKTPFLAAISYADAITERGYKFTFQLEPTGDEVARNQILLLNYMNKLLNGRIKKAAVLFEDTDYGQTASTAQKKYLKEFGYTVAADLSFPSRTPNFDPILIKLKATDPDVVFDQSYLSDAILIAKTSDKLGLLDIPWIAGGTKTQPAYYEAMGKIDQAAFGLSMWEADISPEAKALNERYKAKYGVNLDGITMLLYQGMWVIKEAIEKAGSADREAIQKAMATIEIKPGPNLYMPYEYVKFNPKGLNTGGGFIFVQLQGTSTATVFPERFASKKIDFAPFTKFKK
jgi:branched-chain amino acid transport system substrate-binding protein